MPYPDPSSDALDCPQAAAADWLIARDRGLTAREQAAFLRWLEASPRHATAWKEATEAWARLDRLSDLPDPTASRRLSGLRGTLARHPLLMVGALAASLLLATLFGLSQHWSTPFGPSPASAASLVRLEPRQRTLSDGTRVVLNSESEIAEQFTLGERRVQLVRGEAHFEVARDSSRPFTVVSQGVAIRAVGTAFNVRLDPESIEVLVTEGRVQVAGLPDGAALPRESAGPTPLVPLLSAGERAVVPLTPAGPVPVEVSPLSPQEVSRSLAWRATRLRFHDLSLADVADEFNRHNTTHLVVENSARDVHVAGTFSADNVEVFVRFLEQGFGVTCEREPDGTIRLR